MHDQAQAQTQTSTTADVLSWRNPTINFYQILIFCQTLGGKMLGVIAGWHFYQLTHSPIHLGYIGLCYFLPSFVLSIFAGRLADLLNKRVLIILTQGGLLLVTLSLVAIARQEQIEIWQIYVLLTLAGTCGTLYNPPATAILPNLVGLELLPRAIPRMSALKQLAMFMGPMVAGFACATIFGAVPAYALCATMHVVALVSAFCMRVPQPTAQVDAPNAAAASDKPFAELLAGFRYIWQERILAAIIGLDLVAVLFGSVTSLMPIFAQELLHVDARGLGFLRAAPFAGALLMGVFLARMPIKHGAGRKMIGGVIIYGIATIAFGLSRNFYCSLAILVVLGASDMISVVVRQSCVQLKSPSHVRGRVIAVSQMAIVASNYLGDFESGLVASYLPIHVTAIVGGILAIVTAIMWTKIFPVILKEF